ncbi:MAG: FkbM family methyltransferase [Parvibaculum sp.]|nr:FkbM family methyltransferase [Parvibaculum sp.]
MTSAQPQHGPVLSFRQRLTWIAHFFKAVVRQYLRPMERVLRPLLPEDGVAVDVGAHAGHYSKVLARLVPRGRVYAFEPGAYAHSLLRLVAAVLRLSNVTIVPAGLSDRPGAEVLHVPIKRRGTVGFGLSHLGADTSGRATVEEEIRLTTLDHFAEEAGLARLDFIKVDIEGWEAHFLRGAMKTVERFRPVMQFEIQDEMLARAGSTHAEIFDALAPLGYRVFRLTSQHGPGIEPVDGFVYSADYIFVPAEKAALVPLS